MALPWLVQRRAWGVAVPQRQAGKQELRGHAENRVHCHLLCMIRRRGGWRMGGRWVLDTRGPGSSGKVGCRQNFVKRTVFQTDQLGGAKADGMAISGRRAGCRMLYNHRGNKRDEARQVGCRLVLTQRCRAEPCSLIDWLPRTAGTASCCSAASRQVGAFGTAGRSSQLSRSSAAHSVPAAETP